MRIEFDANEQLEKILDQASTEIYEEAGRIADQMKSPSISADYVRLAADRLRYRPGPPPWADLLMNFGILFAGSAAGVGATAATASETPVVTWLAYLAIAGGCIGTGLAGAGLALKVRST